LPNQSCRRCRRPATRPPTSSKLVDDLQRVARCSGRSGWPGFSRTGRACSRKRRPPAISIAEGPPARWSPFRTFAVDESGAVHAASNWGAPPRGPRFLVASPTFSGYPLRERSWPARCAVVCPRFGPRVNTCGPQSICRPPSPPRPRNQRPASTAVLDRAVRLWDSSLAQETTRTARASADSRLISTRGRVVRMCLYDVAVAAAAWPFVFSRGTRRPYCHEVSLAQPGPRRSMVPWAHRRPRRQ